MVAGEAPAAADRVSVVQTLIHVKWTNNNCVENMQEKRKKEKKHFNECTDQKEKKKKKRLKKESSLEIVLWPV